MSFLQISQKNIERERLSFPSSIVMPLIALAIYCGAVGFIGSFTVHDFGDDDTSRESLLFP